MRAEEQHTERSASEARASGGVSRKRFLATSLGGAVTFSSLAGFLAACGSDGGTAASTTAGKPPAAPTGSAIVALSGPPVTLDPSIATSTNDYPILGNIYEALVTYEDGELRPELASAFSANDDATTWTFELRQGVRFHDGAPLDAAALKQNIDYYRRPTSADAFLIGAPTKVDASDPATLVVTFRDPNPEFGRYMASVKIISPKLLSGPAAGREKQVASAPSGTGAFAFVSRSQTDVALKAFDGYWGTGPYFERLTFKAVPDESTRISALQAGDVNLVLKVAPTAAEGLKGDPKVKLTTIKSLSTMQLSLATKQKPFDDLRVRQALAYAIDYQGLVDAVMRGKGEVTGSMLPPAAYGYSKPQTQYPHDPDKAKSLLKQAGHSGPVPFTMVTYTSAPSGSSLGQAIAQMANDAGFAVKFEVVDDGVGGKDLAKPAGRKWNVHMLENGFLGGSALHLPYVTFYSQYDGRDLLAKLAKMNAVPDGPERLQAMADVQEAFARELPQIPLFAEVLTDALDATIDGYRPALDGYQPHLKTAYRAAA